MFRYNDIISLKSLFGLPFLLFPPLEFDHCPIALGKKETKEGNCPETGEEEQVEKKTQPGRWRGREKSKARASEWRDERWQWSDGKREDRMVWRVEDGSTDFLIWLLSQNRSSFSNCYSFLLFFTLSLTYRSSQSISVFELSSLLGFIFLTLALSASKSPNTAAAAASFLFSSLINCCVQHPDRILQQNKQKRECKSSFKHCRNHIFI